VRVIYGIFPHVNAEAALFRSELHVRIGLGHRVKGDAVGAEGEEGSTSGASYLIIPALLPQPALPGEHKNALADKSSWSKQLLQMYILLYHHQPALSRHN